MRFYLTETIFIENDIYYHEVEDTIKEVKEINWHILLHDYGWNKLNKKWIVLLNKLSPHKKKNSTFGSLDCGGNGDCLFNCISHAINNNYMNEYDSIMLRNDLSNSITEETFTNLIDIYQILKYNGDFKEEWDPDTITLDGFKEILREGGNNYWGDFLILNLLKTFLNINFIILYSNDNIKKYYYYPLLYEYDKNINTIILLYEDENHFKLVGHFLKNRMNFFFNHEEIPIEILKLIQEIR
tara:strand:- start:2774 stop:3496 length:723 start_codon:yes stop_codon:yes gene_type:complete